MKTQIKLGSIVRHGIGGPQSGAIALIYEFLLGELNQTSYKYISVNQIGDDLDEVIVKMPVGQIYVNVRYPADEDFKSKSIDEQNRIRLEIMHTGLLRIAKHEGKLDIGQLESIKEKILTNNFSFSFLVKTFTNPRSSSLSANLIIEPKMDRFDYFISTVENGTEKCKVLIYEGATSVYYFGYFFTKAKWKGDNELIITGNRKEVAIHVLMDKCKVVYESLAELSETSAFEIYKANSRPKNN
ncbi:MAG: hypothetical protein J0I32_08070 [Sphingobacteriales bacterium]|nr:hypothetical protein [Sphingobacteriales bacterium]OJV99948.1 MAG: hypothetical protein BGO52_02425 [Sphingobacteriales bacterium 44-61]